MSKIDKDEMAICNCCKCCCETFQLYYRGSAPTVTYTAYLAKIDGEICTACEVCAEKCPMEAIAIDQACAHIDEKRCIGCGVCAYHCPAGAAVLERTGQRSVFVPPPRFS
ncbi:MAG: 4Fe-4S binding protein [Proteobacteria bacterium]|nr:4Fe-4S binding protein [Pseudomonadota bacterium]